MLSGRNDETFSFESFVRRSGERVERALVSAYGVEIGTEAYRDALAAAWPRWGQIATMTNPEGYLFRLGQSRSRRGVRWARRRQTLLPSHDVATPMPADERALLPDLSRALMRLRFEQRVAVVLTRSYGYSYREVAELLDTTETAVTNHVHRGLTALRTHLGVTDESVR